MNYIEFVRIIDIEEFSKPENGIIDFKLKAGATKFCYLTDKDLKLTQKSKEKDGNTSYDVELKGFAEISPEDVKSLNGRLVLTGVSDDNRMYWIGDIDFPATIILIPDLNSCEINIACQSLMPIF